MTTTATPTPDPVTYPPRPTPTRSKYNNKGGAGRNRFVPTPRPFTKPPNFPPFKRVRTTPKTTTKGNPILDFRLDLDMQSLFFNFPDITTEKATMPTSTQKLNFPEPALDTSLFSHTGSTGSSGTGSGNDVESYEKSYYDLEKVPATNSMSIDTSSFELDSINFDDDFAGGSSQPEVARPRVRKPEVSENSSHMSRVPIRKVLDIFQELRLSFGRDQ